MPPTKLRHKVGNPTAAFESIVDMALLQRGSTVRQRELAMDIGLDPTSIFRYASGSTPEGGRLDFERKLAKNPWALNCVSSLVIRARTDERVAQLLAASCTDLPGLTAEFDKVLNQL